MNVRAFTKLRLIGAGIGLLLADRLSDDQRKGAGWALMLVGAVTTIPLALEVFGGRVGQRHQELMEGDEVCELAASR